MKFEGTKSYIATEDLKVAVNAAITLERPIIVKGEPGTGKTMLAHEVAEALGSKIITWHIKSTTKAQQGLYEYDAVSRLRDSQLGDKKVNDISISLFILSLLGYISALVYTLGDIGFNIILVTNYIFGALCSLVMIITYLCYRDK